jgi:hypothetical protein
MEETTLGGIMKKREPLELKHSFKQKRTPRKLMSKLEKMEKRANKMVLNDKKNKDQEVTKKVLQYIELKMIKGHSKEEATRMAEQLIMNQA